MSIEIQLRGLAGSPFVGRYLAGDPQVGRLFRDPPFRAASFRSRWTELSGRFSRQRREEAAAALRPSSPAAREKLNRFVEHGGAMITTGQQAGLFSGPLYTIHKALSTVRLAEAAEAILGIPVLPVFWIASEDHDWAEINHAYLVDRRDRLCRLDAPSTEPRPLPIHARVLEPGIETTLDRLAQTLPQKAYTQWLLNQVHGAYVPGRSVADAFGRLIASLLAPFDMLLVDASDPALKRASVPVLRRELESAAEHEAVLGRTVAQLKELGYGPQVPILPSAANLFLWTAHGRERLYRDARGWVTHETRLRHSREELLAVLETEPGRLSPNVLLRPVVENRVFPVLAYVGGPGEITYFGQLRGLFAALEEGMPLVYPRASAVLIEPRIRKALERLGLTEADLAQPRHELVRRHSRASVPAEVEAALGELRRAVTQGFDRVGAASGRLDAMLSRAAGARRNRALLEVAALERTILRQVGRTERAWATRVDAARAHLVPLGSRQERVLNILPFLAEHGPSLLARIAAGIPIEWADQVDVRLPAPAGSGG